MITDIKAYTNQVSPSVLGDNAVGYLAQTKLGQLFTADWKQRLLLAGKVWGFPLGTIAAGGDVTEVVGGGNGTTIDQDQPEAGIGVPAGYYMIPLYVYCSAHGDPSNADADEANIVLAIDLAATVPTDGTKTTATPRNLLDGGGAFPGTAFTACTADLTDPTVSAIIDYTSWQSAQITAASGVMGGPLVMKYEPSVPEIMAGPCAMYLYFGGTNAMSGCASIVVAAVPTSYFPVS